ATVEATPGIPAASGSPAPAHAIQKSAPLLTQWPTPPSAVARPIAQVRASPERSHRRTNGQSAPPLWAVAARSLRLPYGPQRESPATAARSQIAIAVLRCRTASATPARARSAQDAASTALVFVTATECRVRVPHG